MSKLTLLVVDDDDLIIQSLRIVLKDSWKIIAANTIAEIPEGGYHAAFVDMHLTPGSNRPEGLEAIKKIRDGEPHMEIVAMSGDLNRELMEKTLAAGASRFLAKPLSEQEVRLTLEKIEALLLMQQANLRGHSHKTQFIGDSPVAQTIRKQVAGLAGENGPILVLGESGTGKEVVANLLHDQNPDTPLIQVNIAAIPENLFESELFGHLKGSFTGAEQNKMGLTEAAHGGLLFLDEIEALSLPLQVKLLRFLESGEVRRVGSDKTVHVKCRVVVASNRDLKSMIQTNEFREDLYWRISGTQIQLSPLRDRKEDIPAIAQFFMTSDAVRRKTLEADAIQKLQSYDWPGNVRELKRVCQQLILTSPLPVIRAEDVEAVLSPNSPQATDSLSVDTSMGLQELVARYEAKVLKQVLGSTDDVEQALETLKISRSSLYKKIKDYQIAWRN